MMNIITLITTSMLIYINMDIMIIMTQKIIANLMMIQRTTVEGLALKKQTHVMEYAVRVGLLATTNKTIGIPIALKM